MKLIPSLLCIFSLCTSAFAADAPLIPALLNALLPKIAPGMMHDEVKNVPVTAYPNLEQQDGPWSGQPGLIGFRLSDHFSVMFSAHFNGTREEVVSSNPQISVFDRLQNVRLDISQFFWEKPSDAKGPKK